MSHARFDRARDRILRIDGGEEWEFYCTVSSFLRENRDGLTLEELRSVARLEPDEIPIVFMFHCAGGTTVERVA